jgi:hypothetical protein
MPLVKPTIFISSTVRDFQDLRSALKYYLEEAGYRVQLSEFADFDKPIDKNLCEACFDAIRASNVFLLLIGSRRGGWFDEANRVSVTQAEYHVAYEQAVSGRLVVILCARMSAWDQASLFRESGLSGRGQSGEPEDPEHLVAFLREVGRDEEMKAAAPGTGQPAPNWIHRFSTFRDLVEILEVALRLKHDVSSQITLKLVAEELAEYGRQFLRRTDDGEIYCPVFLVGSLMEELNLSSEAVLNSISKQVTLTGNQIWKLALISTGCRILTWIPLTALQIASSHPGLADFDIETKSVIPSEVQRACIRTLASLRALEGAASKHSESSSKMLNEGAGSGGRSTWDLSILTVIEVLAMALAFWRAFAELVNLFRYIRFGDPLHPDPARSIPASPLVDFPEGAHAEVPSRERFAEWIEAHRSS